MEINIPRDREDEFEPKIIPNYKRNVSEIEDKILTASTEAVKNQIKKRTLQISVNFLHKIKNICIKSIKMVILK